MIFLKTKNRDNVAVTIKLYKDENLNFMIYIVGLKKDSLTPKKSDIIDKKILFTHNLNITFSKYSTYKYENSILKDGLAYLYVHF